MKILLALQFWERDREQGMAAARLIADLEPRHNDRADFLFAARFDAKHDNATVEHVSKKFNTFTFTNRHRREEGWPAGPNALWFGTLDHIYDYGTAGKMPEYKAILTFEPDCVPVVPHWINALHSAWDSVSGKGIKTLGHLLQYPPQPKVRFHINGNALFSGELSFLHHIARKIGGCPPSSGWDFFLAPEFKKLGWSDTKVIRSHWNAQTCSAPFMDRITNEGCVFLHGVKDFSAQTYIRNRYLLPRETPVST